MQVYARAGQRQRDRTSTSTSYTWRLVLRSGILTGWPSRTIRLVAWQVRTLPQASSRPESHTAPGGSRHAARPLHIRGDAMGTTAQVPHRCSRSRVDGSSLVLGLLALLGLSGAALAGCGSPSTSTPPTVTKQTPALYYML